MFGLTMRPLKKYNVGWITCPRCKGLGISLKPQKCLNKPRVSCKMCKGTGKYKTVIM